ncbi:hypothetical protein [Methanomethylovorans sp.]|uniref:hypothetical protein n=1 Tax=Methanomethylovorans sp. TaxID=2758717 RepID=UPI00351C4C91
MKQENIYSILLFIAGIAIGSLVTWDITNEPQEATLSIPHMTEGIGENITYELFLYNSGVQEMYIISIDPIFKGKLGQILGIDNIILPVNKMLQPGSAIELHGIVDLNNTNLSKTDFLEMDTVTVGFNVTSVTSCMLGEH